MGIFKMTAAAVASTWLEGVVKARKYTLYEVGKKRIVYVQFSLDGEQHRLSTRMSGSDSVRAIVDAAKGEGFVSGSQNPIEIDEAFIKKLLERVRCRAKRRKIEFSLKLNHLRDAAEKSGGRCAVSGRAFDLEGPFKASVDRIDSSRGYHDGNVRLVCYIANTAMLHFGESALIELAVTLCQSRGLMPTQTDDQSQPARTPARGACTVRSLRATNAPLAA